MPPVSPARVIATNSGLKTLGWRSSESDRGRPASTSLRTSTRTSVSVSFSVWASSTYSARRIVMPELTIVESWRVMTVRSADLIRLTKSMLISLRRVLVGDVQDDQPALLELVGDRLLAVGLDLAGRLRAGEVHRLEDVGRHRALATPPCPMPPWPSRRRSSSGVEERDSARRWVILPARTRAASAASIVCMPTAAAGLHRRGDLVGLALADQVAYRRRRDEHLAGHDARRAVGRRESASGS